MPQSGAPPRLIYARSEAARMLSVSTMTLCRLEKTGALHPVKLMRSKNAKTFYSAEEIAALAKGPDIYGDPAE